MAQSKKKSLKEAMAQTIMGLITSIVIQIVLYPLMNIPVTFNENLIITAVFFLASIIRGYMVRRVFERL